MNKDFNFSSVVSRLCAVLMAFLGFSCHNKAGDDLCMYGSPTSTWEIKGEVTDEANLPVTDATIKVTYTGANSSEYSLVTTNTDEAGNYIAAKQIYVDALKVVCLPGDPGLRADSTVVKLKYSDTAENDDWNMGNASATVNFSLSKKRK